MRLLRRRPPDAPAESVVDQLPEEGPARPLVLVCDDNLSVTELLETMFTLEGWAVEVTTTGLECLAALERAAPDVVVLDQRMPGLSGLEVAATARAAGFDRPILLFSAHLEAAEWRQLSKLGLLPVSKLDFPAILRHVTAARRQYLTRMRHQAKEDAPAAD